GRRAGRNGGVVRHLLRGDPADPAVACDPQGRGGDLYSDRHAPLGDHAAGRAQLSIYQQPGLDAAAAAGRPDFRRRPHTVERGADRGLVLGGHRTVVAAGQSHPHRQADPGRLYQPARADPARVRTRAGLSDRVDDLWRAGGARRCVAGVVSWGERRQCRGADRECLYDRDPGWARQCSGVVDRRLYRRLCRDDHRLSDRADPAADPGAGDPRDRHLPAAAGPARAALMGRNFRPSRLLLTVAVLAAGASAPLWLDSYYVGIFTVAYYFGVFAMSWDLLFGFAGEVNFGPTFLIGVGAYTAGILNNRYGWSVYLCIILGALASVIAGFVLALPALRVTGPYFGLV